MRAIGKLSIILLSLCFFCATAKGQETFYDKKNTLNFLKILIQADVIKGEFERTDVFLQRVNEVKQQHSKITRITLESACEYDADTEEMLCYTPFIGKAIVPIHWGKEFRFNIFILNNKQWSSIVNYTRTESPSLAIVAKLPLAQAKQVKKDLLITGDILPILFERQHPDDIGNASSFLKRYSFFIIISQDNKKTINFATEAYEFHMMDTKTGKIYGTLKPENTR